MKTIEKYDANKSDRFVVPSVDIKEENDSIILVADLPGVSKDDLNIEIDNQTLTISGFKNENLNGYKLLYSERPHYNFKRVFEIDQSVNAENINASIKDGILTLELKKAEKAKPKRIEIKEE